MAGSEIDLATVRRRAVRGVATLTGRTLLLQIISFVGFFLLTVYLDKTEIGLFFAISELVAVLGYFSDIGLAAALIQKKTAPLKEDIQSTFTIQQILVISLVGLVFLITPFLANFYEISQAGVFLLWSLTIGFFFASLKTIPSVLLERQLRFDLLAAVEIVENLIFYGLAVLLAYRGFGVAAYAWAVLARGAIGVALIYRFSSWPIGLALSKKSLRRLLKFGIPYQANSLLALVKDRLMSIFLWKIVGAGGVGILGWAQKWAQMPLRLVMDSVIKVSFPAYARMQGDKKQVALAVEKTLRYVSLMTFPLLTGMALLAGPLIKILPRYAKWEIALVSLNFFIINSFLAVLTTPLVNALMAIGRVKTVFKLMVMWTILTWLIYPLLAIKYGYNGAAAASALVSASSLIAIRISRNHIAFRFFNSIRTPALASLLMGVWIIFLWSTAFNLPGIIFIISSSGFIYGFALCLFGGKNFLADVRQIILIFRAGKL